MLGILSSLLTAGGWQPVAQAGGVPQTPEALFQQIFVVFIILGTLVGVVVIGYTLLNAYKYRDGTGTGEKADVTRPSPGQIPTGSGGGKKLFLSFGISAVIVLSLIIWTYSALLYVENPPEDPDLTVEVVGEQFSWQFIYPNNETSFNEMVVPEGAMVRLEVRTADVFHNFGIPAFRTKADAMPGHTTDTWFVADETGNFSAHCYELCGSGHSGMDAQVRVVSQQEYEQWVANLGDGGGNQTAAGNQTAGGNGSAGGNASAALTDAAVAVQGGVGA